jgi:GTP-binding protein
LVADQPGLTRDRKYGTAKFNDRSFIVVDTGGLGDDPEGLDELMVSQVGQAIGEADHVIFLLDVRDGLTASDEIIAANLRKTGKSVSLCINKAEGMDPDLIATDFYSLGLGHPLAISAAHGEGIHALLENILGTFPAPEPDEQIEADKGVKVGVIGRPNVGKSTLVNRLLGEERVIAFDQPGTTRDSISISFEHDGKPYTLIDTAGIRRRARVSEIVEKFSVIKAMQAMQQANVVLLVIDAREGITDQDASLAGHVVESGSAVVMVLNKWDGLDSSKKEKVKQEIARKLVFLDYVEQHFISALHGSGVGHLMEAVDQAHRASLSDLKTSDLTRVLEQAVLEHAPPMVRGRRIKLRYAHQGGRNPPVIVIHGTQSNALPMSYRRYLINRFRKVFHLYGTPIRIELRSPDNPFKGRRNKLTTRQQQKRKRLMKHVKRGKKSRK